MFRLGDFGSVAVCGVLCLLAMGVSVDVAGDVTVRASEREFKFSELTPATRRKIDAAAANAAPKRPVSAVRRESIGDFVSWAIARTPLPPEEESRRAAEVHARIVAESEIVPTPKVAEAVLEKLVADLPPRMRPVGFAFSLTVLDEPGREAFTVGAGRLYVPKDYLEALLADERSGRDRLAFVLAHEIGHVCREHTRRAYQLLILEERANGNAGSDVDRERLENAVNGTLAVRGKRLTFPSSDEQDFSADLFAVHLCRNAGHDLEPLLDALRERILAADPGVLLHEDAHRQQDTPGTTQPDSKGKWDLLLERLQRLRAELDGTVSSPTGEDGKGREYGLFEFDLETGEWTELEAASIAEQERTIVLVHGMQSRLKMFRPLVQHLAEDPSAHGVRILGFQYPNDASLARSGKFLKREVDRVYESSAGADFVCHSAGGLVFRDFAEVEGGRFHKAVFVATPHSGSALSRLRFLLEAKQFVGDLDLGYARAVEQTLVDGKKQMGYDVEPDSLFLRYLNRDRGTEKLRQRYAVMRGRAIKQPYAALTAATLAAGRTALRRKVQNSDKPETAKQVALRWIDRLELPKEITRGDLAVSLDSAALAGVTHVSTFRLNHVQLPRHPAVIEAIGEFLFAEDGG